MLYGTAEPYNHEQITHPIEQDIEVVTTLPISYLSAFWKSLKDSVSYLGRACVTAAHNIALPIIVSNQKKQLTAYSIIKPWQTVMLTMAYANLYSIFICINNIIIKHPERVGIYFRQGFIYSLLASAVSSLFSLAIPYFLAITRQPEEAVDEAFNIAKLMALANMAEISVRFLIHFLNAVDRTKITVAMELFTVISNLLISYLLITRYEMGLSGIMWAVIIPNFSVFLLTLLHLKLDNYYESYRLFDISDGAISWYDLKYLFKLGMPRGIDKGLEKSVTAILTTLIGSFGANKLIAVNVPAQFNEAFKIPVKEFHKVFSRNAGVEFGKESLDNTIKYSRLAQIILPGFTVVVLGVAMALSKHLIAATIDVDDPNNTSMVSSAFWFLAIKCIADFVSSIYKGTDVWFVATGDTVTPMMLNSFSSGLILGAALLLSQEQVPVSAILASELIGLIPATLLLVLSARYQQIELTKQPVSFLRNTGFPNAEFSELVYTGYSSEVTLEQDESLKFLPV